MVLRDMISKFDGTTGVGIHTTGIHSFRSHYSLKCRPGLGVSSVLVPSVAPFRASGNYL